MEYYRKSELGLFILFFVALFFIAFSVLLVIFMIKFDPSLSWFILMIIMELIALTGSVYFFILTVFGDSIVFSETEFVKNSMAKVREFKKVEFEKVVS